MLVVFAMVRRGTGTLADASAWAHSAGLICRDLPLPLASDPMSPAWQPTIAICAIMKDEHPQDLKEWIRYHRCVLRGRYTRSLRYVSHTRHTRDARMSRSGLRASLPAGPRFVSLA
jgi:hypothetical protein